MHFSKVASSVCHYCYSQPAFKNLFPNQIFPISFQLFRINGNTQVYFPTRSLQQWNTSLHTNNLSCYFNVTNCIQSATMTGSNWHFNRQLKEKFMCIFRAQYSRAGDKTQKYLSFQAPLWTLAREYTSRLKYPCTMHTSLFINSPSLGKIKQFCHQ